MRERAKDMPKIAIIGTREASKEKIALLAEKVNKILSNYQDPIYIVSGNAEGVDQVANLVLSFNFTHYLPWNNFNENLFLPFGNYITKGDDTTYDHHIKQLFPWVFNKSQGFIKLIRRNMFIINGCDLVIWYTGKGVTGGTAYGIKYAQFLGIKTFELKI